MENFKLFLLGGIPNLGAVLGCFWFSWLCNVKGRKAALLMGTILKIFGWVLVGLSPNYHILLLGRYVVFSLI